MFDTIYIYVPEVRQLIKISEGTGDNLTDEDTAEGFVDYIYYEQYSRETDFPEVDGGMILMTELIRDKYESMKECIPAVLDMAFGDATIDCIVLD